MKKTAIITQYGEYNFGNKLQNYALLQTLNELGFETDTLVFDLPLDRGLEKKKRAVSFRRKIKRIRISTFKRKIKNLTHKKSYSEKERKRELIFREFSERFLCIRKISTDHEMELLNQEYDYFVVGSDQVWNPDYISSYRVRFAEFADKKKRIAYAASIGKDQISSEFEKEFQKGLDGMYAVSVREERAKKLLYTQFHKDSVVLPDPTILLTRDEWGKLAGMSKNREKCEKKVVMYFLGGYTKYPRKEIEVMCQKYGWGIAEIGTPEGNEYVSGPLEFLNLIKEAPLVVTDSFHGTVFSILFHTSFVVFPRDNQKTEMYQRIEQLLNWFNLEKQEYDSTKSLDNYLTCDFSMVEDRQKQLAADAEKFLRGVLR